MSPRPASPQRIRVLRVIARLNLGRHAWNAVLLTVGTRARYPTVLAVGATGRNEADIGEGDVRSIDACRRAVRGATYVLHQAALPSVPRSVEDPQICTR